MIGEVGVLPFEDRKTGHKSKNAGGIQKVEKAMEWILPYASQKKHS